MIVNLPGTTASEVNRQLVELRKSGGVVTLGRVLTLIIVAGDDAAEDAVAAANDASREHPCRVLVLARGRPDTPARLDGEIRVGGDAGAAEIVLLRMHGPLVDQGASVAIPLLLPDTPVVTWWPGNGPLTPTREPLGRLAQRRITDAAYSADPRGALWARRAGYTPGDTDLAWARLTTWRSLLAAALDQPPYEDVDAATVTAAADSPAADLLAGWLNSTLGVSTRREASARSGVTAVMLARGSGAVELVRHPDGLATLDQPGQPRRRVTLTRRDIRECLAEELRRLDPDEIYQDALLGLKEVPA